MDRSACRAVTIKCKVKGMSVPLKTKMGVQGVLLLFMIAVVAPLIQPLGSCAQKDAKLSPEQQKEFLLHADVIRYRQTGKGITSPYRLTMTDSVITHDASFQPVNRRKSYEKFSSGRTEINFVDSYFYNIAAYRLAGMLGLEPMMPVTVERKWRGMTGSLSWWLSIQMDEKERLEKNIVPPDVESFTRQIHLMRVFSELVYDTDRNAGNVLIGKEWEIYMIDFSRAFRLHHSLKNSRNLERCSRFLFEGLKKLDFDTLAQETEGFLNKVEVRAVIARRDLIVEYFAKLIAEKGEDVVLF
jgi:hypothetical protein